MTNTPSFRKALRDATRTEHVALDESMSSLDLSSAQGYSCFLQIHVASLQRLRPGFRTEDRLDFDALIRCARSDLGDADSTVLPDRETPDDYAHALGIGYVIRGSRLGAQFLRKRVAPAFPTSYLDCATALAWPAFVKQLDAFGAGCASETWQTVLAGATAAFESFAFACGTVAGASALRRQQTRNLV